MTKTPAERDRLRRGRQRNRKCEHSDAKQILYHKLKSSGRADFEYLRRLKAVEAGIRSERQQMQATLDMLNTRLATRDDHNDTGSEVPVSSDLTMDDLISRELSARGGKPKRLPREKLRRSGTQGMLKLLREKTDHYSIDGERILPWDIPVKRISWWKRVSTSVLESKRSSCAISSDSIASIPSSISSEESELAKETSLDAFPTPPKGGLMGRVKLSKSKWRLFPTMRSSVSSTESEELTRESSLDAFPFPPPPSRPTERVKLCVEADVSGGQPPCGRCLKESKECVLATSNRGGSRIRKKKNVDGNNVSGDHSSLNPLHENSSPAHTTPPFQRPLPPPILSPADSRPSALRSIDRDSAVADDDPDDEEDDASTADSAIASAIPRNPSDAWQLLKDVATREADNLRRESGVGLISAGEHDPRTDGTHEARGAANGANAGIASYRLVREGYLTVDVIQMLVRRFSENYHPYLPLVPRKYFDPSQLNDFAVNDKHLLTAVLTISSKDLIEQPTIHMCCSRYMHDLISGIAAGADCEVEAVEALLLLAEWEPQGLRNRIEAVGRGEEDRAAWMHVGIALRTGYYLNLDRTAFRSETEEEAKVDSRKRFAWANCYVSDRLISCRVGKGFWSRGPGPMTGLSSRDFPSLAPVNPTDEDYGKIFQATLDITQLYTNVHDVLYSGMRTSGQMMLMGDYVKYVDDFRNAIGRWNTSWGNLVCSHHIKITLQLSYEYLCLYTNAFVFQAAISQAIAAKPKRDAPSLREHLKSWFSSVAAMPDARFIFASVAAAKAYLTLLSTQVDPVRHLRYMPLRYYLYGIYSAVFLYKARSFGVMDQMEERQVRQLIYHVTEVLKRASVSAQDPGSRYARLLELLWLKNPPVSRPPPAAYTPSQAPMNSPAAASDTQLSTGSLKMDAQGFMQFSPANDFSWLDLEAVGDFVSGDQVVQQHGDTNMLLNMGDYSAGNFVPDAPSWGQMPGSNAVTWQFDLNGNLLF